MDYRTCGAGLALAPRPYHAGLSGDVVAALRFVAPLCRASQLSLAGFSMGGGVALKALGGHADELPGSLALAVAVNPPLDLAASCAYLTGPMRRLYDRYFAAVLARHVARHRGLSALRQELFASGVFRIREFDERVTVPVWGFATVGDYYAATSAAPFVKHVAVPTLILHSRDDPLIPGALFEDLECSDAVSVHLTDRGGHLGFIGVREGGRRPPLSESREINLTNSLGGSSVGFVSGREETERPSVTPVAPRVSEDRPPTARRRRRLRRRATAAWAALP
jgi:predicted alpha/beta-fold hydrolase